MIVVYETSCFCHWEWTENGSEESAKVKKIVRRVEGFVTWSEEWRVCERKRRVISFVIGREE